MKKKLKIVAVVQARIGSTRLPNKVAMKIRNKSLLEHLITRLKRSKLVDEIIIATSTRKQDQKVVAIAKKTGTRFFRGSETDVLGRFTRAAAMLKPDIVVRVCGDQPLTDPEIVDLAIRKHLKSGADYSSTMRKRTFPAGVDAEVLSFKLLKRIERLAKTQFEREHVTPYIYGHPEKFKIQNIAANKKLRHPEITLTVDTKKDFEFIKKIINGLSGKKKFFTTKDVIDFVKKKK